MSDREVLAKRLNEAGVLEDRFIPVENGGKASLVRHNVASNRKSNFASISGNYGVYAGANPAGDRWLIDVDVDDYADDADSDGLEAVDGLPETLTIESPHTDGATGGHRYYVVVGENVAERINDAIGVYNPVPSWGEVRVRNQYVVGPGSELDSCDKDWHDCSEPGEGRYTIANDAPIAEIELEELLEVLRASGYEESADVEDFSGENVSTDDDTDGYGEALKVARNDPKIVTYLTEGAGVEFDGDRSDADFYVACRMVENYVPEEQARKLLENGLHEENNPDTKVRDRGSSYWQRTWKNARRKVSEKGDSHESPVHESSEDRRGGSSWQDVRAVYKDESKQVGRRYAADTLESRFSWMYVVESETLWVYDDETGYFNPWGEEKATQTLERSLDTFYSTKEVKEILSRLEARNQTHRDQLNARNRADNLVCVGNGVLNVRTGELLDHSPEFQFTRGVTHDYDPDAVPELVLRFLRGVTKRDEDMWTLIQQLGHGLLPGHPYKAFIVMFGPGDNGKSAVGSLFRRFVGDENSASVELGDFKEDDFATSDVVGKMINVGDDLSGTKLSDVSMLKRLTGGDTLRANEKFKATFDFQNEAAMFFSGNEPPVFEEQTDALKGRLYPIHMPYRYTQESDDGHKDADPRLVEKIATDSEEMSGLLNLAIQGAQELIESAGDFAMPESPQERMEIYEAASDPIRRFVMDYLEQGGPDDVALKDDVYDVYAAMCRAQDERAATANTFKREVTQQAIVDVESGQTRKATDDGTHTCWKYLRFNSDATEHMSQRLKQRYFDEAPAERDDDEGTQEGSAETRTEFGATPLSEAAQSLTGYVTVTAEVVDVDTYGDGANPTTKAILKDESGAMDLVTWNDDMADRIKAHEGDTVVVENAEVGEHNGTRQLQPKVGLTEIRTIERGVGHTEPSAPGVESQQQVTEAATDGGDVPEDATGKVVHHIMNDCSGGDTLTVASVAGATGLAPDTAKEALNTVHAEKQLLGPASDGWQVL